MLSDDLLNESAQEQSVAMSDAPAAQPQQQSRNATRRRTNMPLNLAREELEQQVDQRAQQVRTHARHLAQSLPPPTSRVHCLYLKQHCHPKYHPWTIAAHYRRIAVFTGNSKPDRDRLFLVSAAVPSARE